MIVINVDCRTRRSPSSARERHSRLWRMMRWEESESGTGDTVFHEHYIADIIVIDYWSAALSCQSLFLIPMNPFFRSSLLYVETSIQCFMAASSLVFSRWDFSKCYIFNIVINLRWRLIWQGSRASLARRQWLVEEPEEEAIRPLPPPLREEHPPRLHPQHLLHLLQMM